ncbi:MAG TPA: hypothetical protein VMW38_19000 [Terriglobia bacterium]|nr:hypothetical protein [Terriglobia bacterium]
MFLLLRMAELLADPSIIHFADIHQFPPFRIVVSVLGLVITMLSVTGIYI